MLRRAVMRVVAEALHGGPERVIAGHVGAAGIDLLAMGGYRHTRIRTVLLGSTTIALPRGCCVPVLVFR